MFDLGFTEILVIGVVALVVLGPEKMPEVARAAGRFFAGFCIISLFCVKTPYTFVVL